jgi:hypothetical protein
MARLHQLTPALVGLVLASSSATAVQAQRQVPTPVPGPAALTAVPSTIAARVGDRTTVRITSPLPTGASRFEVWGLGTGFIIDRSATRGDSVVVALTEPGSGSLFVAIAYRDNRLGPRLEIPIVVSPLEEVSGGEDDAPPARAVLLDVSFDRDPGCDTRSSGPLQFSDGALVFRWAPGSYQNESSNGGICVLPLAHGGAYDVVVEYGVVVHAPYLRGVDGEEKNAILQMDGCPAGTNNYIQITQPGGSGEYHGNFGVVFALIRSTGAQDRVRVDRQVSLAPDVEHRIRWRIKTSSAMGARDGILQAWVNGIQVVDRRSEDIARCRINRFAPYPQMGNDSPSDRRVREHRVRYTFARVVAVSR